jgi:hypothetical protein
MANQIGMALQCNDSKQATPTTLLTKAKAKALVAASLRMPLPSFPFTFCLST